MGNHVPFNVGLGLNGGIWLANSYQSNAVRPLPFPVGLLACFWCPRRSFRLPLDHSISKGQSVFIWLVQPVTTTVGLPTAWLTIGSFHMRLICHHVGQHWCSVDTGVPVPALWLASRAISSAIVDIDMCVIYYWVYPHVGERKIE